jgi:hypothetical protein
MAVSGHLDGGIRFWDTHCNTSSSSGSNTKQLESILPASSRECVTSVMFNSSDTQVISGKVYIWDVYNLNENDDTKPQTELNFHKIKYALGGEVVLTLVKPTLAPSLYQFNTGLGCRQFFFDAHPKPHTRMLSFR